MYVVKEKKELVITLTGEDGVDTIEIEEEYLPFLMNTEEIFLDWTKALVKAFYPKTWEVVIDEVRYELFKEIMKNYFEGGN
jgi:hypothetical protein